jgi:hypothetical protein
MSFSRTLFDDFVASLNLKYFNATELLVGRYREGNGPPPLRLWHNIAPTITIVDARREELGSSVKIISAYRTEAYNNNGNAGRAKLSQHQAYTALDIQTPGHSVEKVATLLAGWQNTKWFYCPLDFQRKAERVKAGNIPFGELPRKFALGVFGVWFTFRGYIKAYPSKSSNFVHIDTRGDLAGSGAEGD